MKARCLVLGLVFGVFSWAVSAVAGPYALESEMQEDLRAARQAVRSLLEGEGNAGAEAARLKEISDNIRIVDLLVQERFRSEASEAGPLDETVRQRHAAAFQHYLAAISHFLALTDSLSDPPDPTALRKLLNLLDRLLPEKQYPLLGSLPYQHLRLPTIPPVTAPPIVPAYKGGQAVVVQAADTQGTPEAPISAPIVQLAESLGWSPVAIYEWVQNNIETEWYWGSMKGAEETLRQRSGNDVDQAALLVALLRAANFPARYVRGVAEFFPNIDQAKRLTGLDDPLQIAALLQKAGIPFEPVIAGGRIANFRFEHIWVEAEIPYANYRGALLDDHGKIWVPFDTHLKPAGYIWSAAADLPGDFPLAGVRDDYLATPREETPLEYLRGRLESHIGNPYSSLLRMRTLPAQNLGILPGSLQFGVHAITGEYTALPAELIHRVQLRAVDEDGRELFAYTIEAARLASRQLILSYEPETVQDQRIIDSYGGLDNTPAYLVHLRPVLLLDGERLIVAREGVPMGASYRLTVTLQAPGGSTETTGQHIAGNLSAIGIACQKIVPPAELPLEEKDAARLLSEEALAYIERWNAAEEELASLLKLSLVRPLPTVVTAGGIIDVTYRLDIPHGFTWKGVFIDAGLRRAEIVAKAGQAERERQFMRLSALQGSILENRLFEDDFGVASVSTAKLLALAPQNLAPLVTLDGTNIDALLPTLNLAGNVKADIENAVHQGFRVTVPEAAIGFKNWSGIGYIKENPETGEAGYMLSGMIAGGMTAEEWAAGYLRDVLQTPYGDPPNQDAQAAAHIAKITVTDRQNGTVGKQVETPLAVLVTDLKGRPVVGAQVTFTMFAGGGSFAGTEIITTVQTGSNGIAKAAPTLGIHTADNPSFQRINQGDIYATQVGVNLFTAAVAGRYGDLSLPQPFEIYGRPDVPSKMFKVLGDLNKSLANNPAGTLKVKVLDQHENPISNVSVTFATKETVSQEARMPLPPGYRGIQFYLREECSVAYPLYGDCASAAALTRTTGHYGAGVETILGDTVNTKYTVEASAPGIAPETFTLSTYGYMTAGDYLAPELFIQHLTTVNDRGEAVNAAKAGEDLAAPLTAAMFMLYNDYTTEKYSCTDAEGKPVDCWRLKGDGLIKTRRMTSDSTVTFTTIGGGGTAGATESSGDGLFRTTYTTGSQPALNLIKAVGEATITIPEVYADYLGNALETGYPTATLPMRTITAKTGQRLLFDQSTKEIRPSVPQNAIYEVYGVLAPATVEPTLTLLGDGGLARENVTVGYTIQPAGAAPDGYQALSAQIDLFAIDKAGTEAWVGYLVGGAVQGTGTAVFSRGTVFDPNKRYLAQTVLNRGSNIEIRGDKVPINTLLADLDIDSDNNAGWHEDGTHKLPSRNPLEDQAEDLIGHPGKVIRPNLLDPDGDKVPGFADGLRQDGVDLYGNQANGQPDSAPFVPLVIELAGSALDPAKATIRFDYPGSDPARVQKIVDATGAERYIPESGSLRLWRKDGPQTRNAEDIRAGGDYLTPNTPYTFAQLAGATTASGWRLYLEGLTASNGTGDQRIAVQIDPDGDGSMPVIEGDAVRATAPLVGLIADYNHNREIDDEDRNRAARGDTFYFWINDDDDSGETDGDDIPLPTVSMFESRRDCDNLKIDGVRDLIDFFPVAIDIKSLLDLFPSGTYSYRLKSSNEKLKVVFPDLTADVVKNYLIDVPTARALALSKSVFPVPQEDWPNAGVYNLEAKKSFNKLLVSAKTVQELPVVLLEGTEPSKAPLVLEIGDEAGQKVFTASLNLSLDGVEQMFRHKNLIQCASGEVPKAGSVWGEPDRTTEPPNCPDPDCLNWDGKNFVFLHGYNVDGQQARGWQAETFKRLFWSGLKGRFWGVSWYGSETQLFNVATRNYHLNIRNAYGTVAALRTFLNSLEGETNLAAHSMGNVLVSFCLNDSAVSNKPDEKLTSHIGNFFMIDAAVAIESIMGDEQNSASLYGDNPMVHPAWSTYRARLGASEWHTLFDAADHRSTLTWRDRFANLPDSINYFNFYSSGEEVLDTHTGDPDVYDIVTDGIGRYAWALQEKLKGRMLTGMVLGSRYGGWGFNIGNPGYFVCEEQILPDSPPVCSMLEPELASAIDDATLRREPFFDAGFNAQLFELGTPGSDYAKTNREKLLAEAFPALTLPAGGPDGRRLNNYLFGKVKAADMQTNFTNGWPEERILGEIEGWRHSDLRNVAYLYIYKIFNKMLKPSEPTQ